MIFSVAEIIEHLFINDPSSRRCNQHWNTSRSRPAKKPEPRYLRKGCDGADRRVGNAKTDCRAGRVIYERALIAGVVPEDLHRSLEQDWSFECFAGY